MLEYLVPFISIFRIIIEHVEQYYSNKLRQKLGDIVKKINEIGGGYIN